MNNQENPNGMELILRLYVIVAEHLGVLSTTNDLLKFCNLFISSKKHRNL
ncbi:hypothetical protein [Psychrobacillus sp. FSL H8-0484]